MSGIRTIEDVRARCRVDADSGCWVWALSYSTNRGAKTPIGYWPAIRKTLSVSRLVWMLTRKCDAEALEGRLVWAGCWNSGCCNPEHLASGTHAQRLVLARTAGRRQECPTRRSATSARVMRAKSHLNEEIIATIRAGNLTNAQIAERYGVSTSQAWKIRTGRSWGAVVGASVFSLWRRAA